MNTNGCTLNELVFDRVPLARRPAWRVYGSFALHDDALVSGGASFVQICNHISAARGLPGHVDLDRHNVAVQDCATDKRQGSRALFKGSVCDALAFEIGDIKNNDMITHIFAVEAEWSEMTCREQIDIVSYAFLHRHPQAFAVRVFSSVRGVADAAALAVMLRLNQPFAGICQFK